MSEESRPGGAYVACAAFVLLGGSVLWMFPRETASVLGRWALPTLSLVGMGLAIRLAAGWTWLRPLLIALASTLVVAWAKEPQSVSGTLHFGGASLGLLSMVFTGQVVATQERLRLALVAFLSSGLVVLAIGLMGVDAGEFSETGLALVGWLPTAQLELWGLPSNGQVNPNALAAAALLIAPMGAAVFVTRRHTRIDLLTLQPLGFVVMVLGALVLVVCRSRTAWLAIWITLAILLARGLRGWMWRVLAGLGLMMPAVLGIYYTSVTSFEVWIQQAARLWASIHTRIPIMKAGLESFTQSPWLGIGMNQFRDVYRRTVEGAGLDVAHAHNIFLQTALDIGLLGLVAYCCVVGLLLFRADQAIRDANTTLNRCAAVGAALSLLAVSGFGLADAVPLGAKIGAFQWTAAGLILGVWRAQSGPQR